jgi:uncharacterized protein (TIGR00296 family)
LEQGKQVVAIARTTLDSFVQSGKYDKRARAEAYMAEKRGVFVTLNVVEDGNTMLRGCIGFPYPIKPLGEAVREAAVLAASDDPRFSPVSAEELGVIVVEVSVLTVPVEVKVKNRKTLPTKVKVGEDGLMMSTEFTGGLLLPQVAPEQGWDSEQFLNNACLKAGLSADSWLLPATKVQTFQADIFAEKSPRGEVEKVSLPVS